MRITVVHPLMVKISIALAVIAVTPNILQSRYSKMAIPLGAVPSLIHGLAMI